MKLEHEFLLIHIHNKLRINAKQVLHLRESYRHVTVMFIQYHSFYKNIRNSGCIVTVLIPTHTKTTLNDIKFTIT